jgi:dihydroorotate dehydrogenase
VPLGANIGKNKLTSEEDTLKDYELLIEGFKDISDYIVINISSPNTPGLRDLQNEEFIKSIFELSTKMTDKPVFLKIAPDLEVEDAINICNFAVENGASGIIATNTTIDYSLLPNPKDFGGISGEVLKEKSFKLFEALAKEFFKKTILISVGGISDGKEAYRRIRAGASLVQAYSSLIFEGPILASKINRELLELLEKDGFENISQAIGADR